MNTLYDLPGQTLRKRGELLRLRKYGEQWVLTHKSKGKAGRHKTRVELETKVEMARKWTPSCTHLASDLRFAMRNSERSGAMAEAT